MLYKLARPYVCENDMSDLLSINGSKFVNPTHWDRLTVFDVSIQKMGKLDLATQIHASLNCAGNTAKVSISFIGLVSVCSLGNFDHRCFSDIDDVVVEFITFRKAVKIVFISFFFKLRKI